MKHALLPGPNRKRWPVLLLTGASLALCGRLLTCAALAAEETGDAEAKEVAAEEAEQRKKEIELDRPIFSYVVGLLAMKDKELRGDNKGVIASVLVDGKEFLIKLDSPELIGQLEKLNGKRVKLRGNSRNKGKYFVMQEAELAAPTDK